MRVVKTWKRFNRRERLRRYWRCCSSFCGGCAGAAFAGMTLGRKSAVRRLENLERLPLGPQHALHLVRLGGSALLISSSPAGCALIHRSEWLEVDSAGKSGQ
jgi:hypothetical protein